MLESVADHSQLRRRPHLGMRKEPSSNEQSQLDKSRSIHGHIVSYIFSRVIYRALFLITPVLVAFSAFWDEKNEHTDNAVKTSCIRDIRPNTKSKILARDNRTSNGEESCVDISI